MSAEAGSSIPPGYRLACNICGLTPGGSADVGMFAEHFIAEHPETCDITGKPKLEALLLGPDESWTPRDQRPERAS